MSINRRLRRTFPALAAIAIAIATCSTAYGLGQWVGTKIERPTPASQVPHAIAAAHRPAHPARVLRRRSIPHRRNVDPRESPG
jgi:hypothetical protein